MTDVMSEQLPRDIQQDMRVAKEAMAGPVPLIGEAPDVSLFLPRGLFHQGQWQKGVIVRELTGADEEVLAKVPDQLAFYDTVIALGVESVGELHLASLSLAERKHYLNQLLLGERDILFVKIAQVSFGDEKDINFTCQRCEVEQTVTLLLSEDFKAKEVEGIDVLTREFITSKQEVIEFRPATGDDQNEALSKKGVTAAEQNTIILSRCMTKLNGGMILDPRGFARGMGIKDRQALLEQLVSLQPMIDLALKTNCVGCGGEQVLPLGWGDIFRP